MTATIYGLKTFLYEEGTGPDLLFLHGWGVEHSIYMPMLRHLAKTYHVTAPDLPGFGETEEPPHAFGVSDYVSFVLALVRDRGLSNPVLMGHSNGGRILIKLMSDPATALPSERMVLLDASGIKPKRGLNYYARVYSYKAGKLLTKPFPELHRRLLSRAGSSDYQQASPVMRGTLSKLVAEDLTPVLPGIKVPTLLLWGENDTATPLEHARLMENQIPDAGLIVFPGGSHYGFLEQWGLCARVLDSFLGGAGL